MLAMALWASSLVLKVPISLYFKEFWVGGRHFAFSAREVSGDKDPGLFTGGWHRAPPPANAYPALSSIANAVKVVSFIGRAPLSLF